MDNTNFEHIFSFLSKSTIGIVLPLVCKEWRLMTKSYPLKSLDRFEFCKETFESSDHALHLFDFHRESWPYTLISAVNLKCASLVPYIKKAPLPNIMQLFKWVRARQVLRAAARADRLDVILAYIDLKVDTISIKCFYPAFSHACAAVMDYAITDKRFDDARHIENCIMRILKHGENIDARLSMARRLFELAKHNTYIDLDYLMLKRSFINGHTAVIKFIIEETDYEVTYTEYYQLLEDGHFDLAKKVNYDNEYDAITGEGLIRHHSNNYDRLVNVNKVHPLQQYRTEGLLDILFANTCIDKNGKQIIRVNKDDIKCAEFLLSLGFQWPNSVGALLSKWPYERLTWAIKNGILRTNMPNQCIKTSLEAHKLLMKHGVSVQCVTIGDIIKYMNNIPAFRDEYMKNGHTYNADAAISKLIKYAHINLISSIPNATEGMRERIFKKAIKYDNASIVTHIMLNYPISDEMNKCLKKCGTKTITALLNTNITHPALHDAVMMNMFSVNFDIALLRAILKHEKSEANIAEIVQRCMRDVAYLRELHELLFEYGRGITEMRKYASLDTMKYLHSKGVFIAGDAYTKTIEHDDYEQCKWLHSIGIFIEAQAMETALNHENYIFAEMLLLYGAALPIHTYFADPAANLWVERMNRLRQGHAWHKKCLANA